MYIENALKGKTNWWLYLLGFLVVFIGWQFVGSIPMLIVLLFKGNNAAEMPTDISGFVSLLGSNTFLILTILGFACGLVSLFVWVKFVHQLSIKHLTTSRKKVDWKRIFFSFIVVCFINGGIILLDYYLNPGSYQYNFSLMPFLILVMVVLFLPLQTSMEEYLFRGYLMQGLGVSSNTKWLPLVITSVTFGLMHILNPEVTQLGPLIMVYYIGTGFALGVMTLMDEGMELALGFHAGNNMLAALLVTSDWSALQTDSVFKDISTPSLGIDVFIPVLLQAAIILFFAKIYKWKGWKEKLFGKLHNS